MLKQKVELLNLKCLLSLPTPLKINLILFRLISHTLSVEFWRFDNVSMHDRNVVVNHVTCSVMASTVSSNVIPGTILQQLALVVPLWLKENCF